jgi:hypothetical protein
MSAAKASGPVSASQALGGRYRKIKLVALRDLITATWPKPGPDKQSLLCSNPRFSGKFARSYALLDAVASLIGAACALHLVVMKSPVFHISVGARS